MGKTRKGLNSKSKQSNGKQEMKQIINSNVCLFIN